MFVTKEGTWNHHPILNSSELKGSKQSTWLARLWFTYLVCWYGKYLSCYGGNRDISTSNKEGQNSLSECDLNDSKKEWIVLQTDFWIHFSVGIYENNYLKLLNKLDISEQNITNQN